MPHARPTSAPRAYAYYFRIQPTFETADARYGWLNALVAVGYGKRTAAGVRYRVFGLA